MSLTLRLVDPHQLMQEGDTVRELDQGTLTIGRALQNDWVLPDPERVISSRHCSIEASGDSFRLTDTSSNGVFHNGADEPVGQGNTVAINDGDKIRISHFQIDVSVTGAAHASEWADRAPRPAPLGDDPFASDGLHGPTTQMNIDDILEGPASSAATPPGQGYGTDYGAAEGGGAFGIPEQIPPEADFTTSVGDPVSDQEFFKVPDSTTEIPDDWDTDWSTKGAPGAGDPVGATPAVSTGPASDPFADAPAAIPEEWDTDAPSSAGPQALIPEDPFVPDDGAIPPVPQPAPPVQAAPPAVEPTPVAPVQPAPIQAAPIQAAPIEAAPIEAAPVPVTAPPPAPPPPIAGGAGASDRRAVQAFLEGAELGDLEIGDADVDEIMRLVGAFYRETVKSLMEVLAARSSIKSEFRLSQTVIRPVENNPLKFSLGATDAMTSLLTKRGRDYLPPLTALQQAFDDVKAHQVAVMVGMQVAITDLLKRFDPAAIERRIDQDSKGGTFSLKGKDSRYWADFTKLYETLAAEAEDDFQSLFGREFAKAYEDQVRKLAVRGAEE